MLYFVGILWAFDEFSALIDCWNWTVQTCKNIVLAGIGSLTLIDDSPLTLEASAANFLIQFDELEGQAITLAEACAASLRDYNPMVHVKAEAG